MTGPARIAVTARAIEIDLALSGLRDYWLAHPQLRLGQLVVSATSSEHFRSGQAARSLTLTDVFMVEDATLMLGLAGLPS